MKSDITKYTFKPEKHFSSVRLQQGRVQLDSDWNEQADIQNHLRRTAVGDLIAPAGAPRENAGFTVSVNADGSDLSIGPGRLYVDGLLCENETTLAYSRQPEYPGAPEATAEGLYLAYLEIFERSVTALEDLSIREKALGGPDTATRQQIVRQVKLLPVTEPVPAPGEEALTRITIPPEWTALIDRSRGRMRALTETDGAAASPCEFGARGGYLGAENRLYRVEIHGPGAPGTATFKWSRDNGSFATKLLRQDGDLLTVENAGQDETRRFVPGGWVEVIDEARELQGRRGTLLQITHVQGRGLTFKTDNVIHYDRETRDPARTQFDIDEFDEGTRKVRRWDMSGVQGEIRIPAAGGVLELEDGIRVEFESDAAATYRTGDAWMIPARTATGNIEWPCAEGTDQPALRGPHGDDHRFTRLAFIRRTAAGWSQAPEDLVDCRDIFDGMIYLRPRPPESMSHARFPHGLEQNEIDKFPDEDLMAGVRTIQDALDRLYEKKVNKTGDVITGPLEVVGDLIIKGELMARAEENMVGRVALGENDGDSVTIHGYLTSNHSEGHLRLDDSLHVTENLIVDGDNHSTNPESEFLARFSGPGDFAVGASGSPRDRLVIKDDGLIGMGVPAPEARLHLGGSMKIDGANTLEFGASSPDKEADAGKIGYRALSTDALDITGAGDTTAARKIKFWNEGGAAFAGKIGVGLDAPDKTLEVAGEARIENNLSFGAPDTNGDGDSGLIRADDPDALHVYGAAGKELRLGADGQSALYLDRTGQLGVGIPEPLANLHVSGATPADQYNPYVLSGETDIARGQDLALSGDYAYFLSQLGLRVVDITDPAHPTVVGMYDSPGSARAVAVAENHAYIADYASGVQEVDVTDPANPVLVRNISVAGATIVDVFYVGRAVFVATDFNGNLWWIFTGLPTPPEVVALGTPTNAVFVSGNLAYTANHTEGFRVTDVSDRTAPVPLGQLSIPGQSNGVFVQGKFAYVARDNGMHIVDVSDPASPTVAGTYDDPSGYKRVEVVGTIAYLTSSEGSRQGLHVIDVSDPANPTLLQHIPMTAPAMSARPVDGDLYLATGEGIKIFSSGAPLPTSAFFEGQVGIGTTAPEAMLHVSGDRTRVIAPAQGTLNHVGGLVIAANGHFTRCAYVEGDIAFLAVGSKFYAVNVADRANPVALGQYALSNSCEKLVVYQSRAYIAFAEVGLVILDVSDPANPAELSTYDTSGIAADIALQGNHVFIADHSRGLLIVDISDPANPTTAGVLDTATAFGVCVSGTFAYVADLSEGLLIIDISDPTRPVRRSSLDLPGSTRNVAVSGQRAYLADQEAGLHAVDISNPDQPVSLGAVSTNRAYGLTIKNDLLYLADLNDLIVYDISASPLPEEKARHATTYSNDVFVADGGIFVADGDNGLQIFSYDVEPSAITTETSAIFSGSVQIQGLPGTDGLTFPDGTHQTTAGGGGGDSTPLGTIMAWHKSMTGTPAIPAGWVECNGQVLNDSASPYNGQTIPNLNGDPTGANSPDLGDKKAMFLRGGLTSGTGQEDAFQGHWHIAMRADGSGVSDTGFNPPGQGSHPYGLVPSVRSAVGDGTNGNPRTDSETRPTNMSVVWIMKVKQVVDATDDESVWKSVPSDHAFTERKIGIGTSTPEATLHIGGSPGVDGIMFPDGTLQTTAGGGGGDSTPLGTIMAWHKSMTGTPAIPAGWVECNGQVLNDSASPYNGQTIPNLNGDPAGANSPDLGEKKSMFLRGGLTSGAGQDFAAATPFEKPDDLYYATGTKPVLDMTQIARYDEGKGSVSKISAAGTEPVNMSVVWIMKVKQVGGSGGGDSTMLTTSGLPAVLVSQNNQNHTDPTATGASAVAMGSGTQATGDRSTVMGEAGIASGTASVALNRYTRAEGDFSTAIGNVTTASGTGSFAMGTGAIASGNYSTAMGFSTQALSSQSVAMGRSTKAEASYSVAMGSGSTASGSWSVATGNNTIASGPGSFTTGAGTEASGNYSTAIGLNTKAIGPNSFAMGNLSQAERSSSAAMGFRIKTLQNYSLLLGINSQIGTDNSNNGTILGLGWGGSEPAGAGDRNLVFKVNRNGTGYFDGAADLGAADYAEYFETDDGQEIAPGYFVSFAKEDRIRTAGAGDDILGIVSAAPGVVGDSAWSSWAGRYKRDEFDRYIYEEVEVEDETTGEKHVQQHRVEVDGYDPNKTYVPRAERPEWVPVGLLGKLYVHAATKTLKPGDYVTSNDEGKAVKVKKGQRGWRVLSVKPKHKLVRVMFRS